MSAFEVSVTPTRIKNARKINSAREPTNVFMAPFSAKAIVLFEDVPITKTARRYLNIFNPTDDILETHITKNISDHLNVQIEWTSSSIPARSMVVMEIIWNPIDVIIAKETLQITDDRNFHKDIKFIFKSIDKSRPTTSIKTTTKFPRLSSAAGGGGGGGGGAGGAGGSAGAAAGGIDCAASARPLSSLSTFSSSSSVNSNKSKGVYLVQKKPLKKSPPKHLRKKSQENSSVSRILTTNTSGNVVPKMSANKIIEKSFKSPLKIVNTHLDASMSDIFCFTATSPKTPKSCKTNIENISPNNNIFDKINFSTIMTTPMLSTNDLASLPTPTLPSENRYECRQSNKLSFDQQQNINPETPKRKYKNYQIKTDISVITSLALETTPCVQNYQTMENKSFEISPQIFNFASQSYKSLEAGAAAATAASSTTVRGAVTTSTVTAAPSSPTTAAPLTATITEDVNKFQNYNPMPNKTFELPKSLTLSPSTVRNPLPALEHNHCNLSIPPTLSMILEDDSIDENNIQTISQKTFNISRTNSKQTISCSDSTNSLTITKSPQQQQQHQTTQLSQLDQPLIGTPLRKKFQSMRELNNSIAGEQKMLKNNQGSMPNLNDIVIPFENNRYFYQSNERYELNEHENQLNSSILSTISTKSVQFRENEILAQSSQFNLNNCPIEQNKMDTIFTSTATKKRCNEKFVIPKSPIRKLHTSFGLPTILVTPSSASASAASSPKQSSSCNNTNIKRLNDDSIKKISQEFSPPKRFRPSSSTISSITNNSSSFTSTANTKGQTMYIQNWRGVKPKKINNLKPLQLKRPIKDERVILFDAEMHIQSVINPDPFAASTTIDPFLAATMYLEDEKIDKHETDFKKWLNVLVTIPDDLDSGNIVNVDYGRIFNDVRNKDLTLAESKETVSSNYFIKYRLEGLRRAAVNLYVSDEMKLPLQKLLVNIERKLIQIRIDRDLHRNFVLQREILELLLCINPLWLRLGLEVVFGEKIPMETNSDIISLSTFILNRVFKDKYIEMKHNRMYAQSAEYGEHIRKFTLKKILMLLFFLDLAKTKKIIHHNPCLFVKTSEIKETKQILLKFSSIMLANVGDIQRDLRRIGIILQHKQTYLDEFDYAFRNLAIDLRDGVRLTKVMEIILMRDDLHERLRVPAISRLQRVHNVDLALKALAEADFQIVGSIMAADIADGHREKTLSLLWQIIYKFRAPKFNVAASLIQIWWRKSWLRVCIRRRIEQKLIQRRINAAVCIQSAFRMYICRKHYIVYRDERVQAVRCLQRYTKTVLAVKKFKKTIKSIRIVQQWYRNVCLTNKTKNEYLNLKSATIRIQRWYRTVILSRKLEAAAKCIRLIRVTAFNEHTAAVLIQQRYRAWQLMKKQQHEFHVIRDATIKIQHYYRSILLMRLERQKYKQLKTIAILIQRKFRAKLLLRQQFNDFVELRKASITIQHYFRGILLMRNIRAEYLLIKKTTIFIQRKFRANLLMKKQRNEFIVKKQATIRIQQQYRAKKLAKKIRIDFLMLRTVTIFIQRQFRAKLLMKYEQTKFEQLKNSCLTIQKHFRSNKLAKQQRKEFLNIKQTTIMIQQWFRATKLMQIQFNSYTTLRNTTIYIQQRFRANKLCAEQQIYYKALKKSVIFIQRQFRANKIMKIESENYRLIKTSVLCIQSRYRAYTEMKLNVKQYQNSRKAIICIQQHFRAYLLMKKQKNEYLVLRQNVLFIQRLYRSNRMAIAQRNTYQQIKQSVRIIQQHFRAYLLMKKQRSQYLNLRTSAIRIQTHFRSYLLMKLTKNNYQHLRKHVQFIQQKFKSNLLMKKQKKSYIELRLAVITCQRKYRAKLLMKKCKKQYETLKSATICIQQRFRAKQQMICDRNEYQKTRKIIKNIQRKYRANVLMKMQQNYYQKLQKSVIFCQRLVRANHLARTVQTEYQIKKTTVIFIQRKFRAKLLMIAERNKYIELKSAVLFCQTRYRANIKMMNDRCTYLCLRVACIRIQQQYRAQIIGKKQKLQYQTLKSKVIFIQRIYRARLLARNQRAMYLNLKSATLLIQRRFTAHRAMKINLKTYTNLRKYCVIIQQRWRAKLQMIKCRENFLQLKSSVTVVQQRFRALLLMKQQLIDYKSLRSSVIFIQHKFLANLSMKQERGKYLQLKTATILIQQKYRAIVAMSTERKYYQTLKLATIFIQRKFRANLLAQTVHNEFLLLKTTTIKLQTKFRANKQMKQQRFIFLQLKSAAIFIQQQFRSNRLLAECRNNYQRKLKAIILIQRKFRANMLMKCERQIYQEKLKKIKLIQQYYRSYLQMKYDRTNYEQLRSAVVIIQQRYRANQLAKNISNQYKLIKTMAIYIQRKFRAYKAMKLERCQFLQLRLVCVHIQQKYRGHKQMLVDRAKFLKTLSIIVGLQARIRGYLARSAYLAKITPEMIEAKRRNKAARFIQTVWRAHFVRKKCTAKITQIRNKIATISKNVKPENTLKNRIIYSVRVLRGRYNMVDQLKILEELVKISREVPQTLEEHSIVIANFCYGIMSQAIRSEPDKQLIELCSYVILNLARYLPTKRYAYQKHGLVTVAQMLLRWSDKDCQIFNALCTAIWLFSKCPEMKLQIRQYMTTYEAGFMLVEIKRMVIRKENMRNNRSNKNLKLMVTPQQKRLLPMVQPDFGIKLKNNQPYLFYCSIFAFDTILKDLDINQLS